MKFVSIIIFILFSNLFISNAQEKCNTDHTCRNSKYCGDDMTCFCSKGICKYGPGPIITKNNTNITLSLRKRYVTN